MSMKIQRDFRQSMERSGPEARMGGLQSAEACPGHTHEKGLSIKCRVFWGVFLALVTLTGDVFNCQYCDF